MCTYPTRYPINNVTETPIPGNPDQSVRVLALDPLTNPVGVLATDTGAILALG
jgi:hypothetical protein